MCEFKVLLNGEIVMEDVIYVKTENDTTVLQDIVGNTTSFKGVRIVEVNVTKTRLVLDYI